ncbi:TonB-dependent receptor [Pontibacter mangrovi]|uniref:TonB-dependent receptor n=1 Tax=Pontibacter mangrovi TaxID=2589816 RepID=A0A501WCZ5_9BACT|nr:TonB-dependent receptor [Pontibacter mangrovi]TPE46355.1 TonB-dependent receptor [Pontibacter mangrovi]
MRFLVLIWGCFLPISAAFAQGAVEVTVLNPKLEPVPQVQLTVTNEAIGYSATRTTNSKGITTFSGLNTAGTYTILSAENALYTFVSSEPITLRSNFTRTVTLVLPFKREVELQGVTVYAPSTTRINLYNAEVSSEMRIAEIQELPVEGRDVSRMLYRLPNVTQATGFFPETPNVSINGANPLFNNYLIDGLDNNEQFLGGSRFNIPVGFVQNVSVLTNNYSAEFGNTGNGIINITSRSGSNELQGEVFFLTRPGFLDASSPYAQRDLSGNQVKDGFQRYQTGFGVGGPILQDKTFYYLNYEHTTDLKDNILRSPALGVNETVRGKNYFNYLSGKVDHYWSNRFHSALRANVGIVGIGRQAGGLTGGLNFPSAASDQVRNSLNLASTNVYTSGNLTLETNLQYARFRWDYASPENPASPDVTVAGPTGETVAVLGHPGYAFESVQHTWQAQQKATWSRGSHTFKAGAEMLSTDHALFGGGNPNGSYTVQLTQAQLESLQAANLGSNLSINDIPSDVLVTNYAVELRPTSFGKRQNIYTLYFEDQLQATERLNLNLGLRYDYDNLSRGGNDRGDYNNLAPRFSFNYQLSPNSTIRGGFGLFYDKILYTVYSDALQQNNNSEAFKKQLSYFVEQGILPSDTDLDRVSFNGNLTVGQSNNAGLPYGYLQGPPAESFADQRNLFSNERRILNPNGYDNPYTQQFSLGYQLQMAPQKLFYVDLVYNRGRNLFRTVNLNAPAAWDYSRSEEEGIARSSAWADETRPLPIYGNYAVIDGKRVEGVSRSLVMTESEGESNYYAASFNLQKDKAEDKFSYRLIYTLSYLENNTEDINFRAMDANNFEAEWGPSINDRRHVINAIYNYHPLQNLTLTVAALLQSGQPINRIPDASNYSVVDRDGNPIQNNNGDPIFTNDLNGDGAAFGDAYVGNSDRQPGEARNSDRLPWSNTFEASVQYFIPFGSDSENGLEIRADVFNLFNAENLSGYSNNATQSNQIQVGPASSGVVVRRNAAPPRQFQFGVRYVF